MNYAFDIYGKSIIIRENEMEIYVAGHVVTQNDYDLATFAVLNYLWLEGFLETRPTFVETVYVFDGSGQQIFRENCV